mgnify:CR=1 FL=1
MNKVFTLQQLQQQSALYQGSGGCSEENHNFGFQPAFFDSETGEIYPSCLANGTPSPVHSLNGLPEGLVLARDEQGNVLVVKASVVSGFQRDGCFYSRDECSQLAARDDNFNAVSAEPA